MKITLTLSTDERIALRKLANDVGCSLEDGAKAGLRSWLIGKGYLDGGEADNDNEDEESRDEG